ncbi:MAG: hypothetical protein IT384_18015 [Deltaproteobacteria bacterium]|nr:hypothetical protein [Deltaproteobacteria bacterium]
MAEPHNPFEAPLTQAKAVAPIAPGTLDIGVALSQGWQAFTRNLGPWIAVVLVAGVLMFIAAITVFGIIFVVPVIGWGYIHFSLRVLDGPGEVGDLFAGFNRYWSAMGSFLLIGLLYVLMLLPPMGFIFWGALMGENWIVVLGYLVMIGWSLLVFVRFSFAPYFVVDQGMAPVEAISASWHVTAEQKLNVAIFMIIVQLITLAGEVLFLIGIVPAMMITSGATASAYRQLAGRGVSAAAAEEPGPR